jgi:hypothetical protein
LQSYFAEDDRYSDLYDEELANVLRV